MATKKTKLSTAKKWLLVIALIFITISIIGFFIFYLLNLVYLERVSLSNDTENTIEVGIITYCYECDPPEYQIIHNSKQILPNNEEVFSIWWDDEHFETPIFYSVLSNGSREYFCGLDNETTHKWSNLNKIETPSEKVDVLQEVGRICENMNEVSSSGTTPQKIKEHQIQNDSAVQKNVEYPKYEDVRPDYSENEICTAGPWQTDIGRLIFPSSEKYKHLFILGELFTAVNCGGERVDQIFGVEGQIYTLGADMQLYNVPSKELENTLKQLGFICIDENVSECKHWKLDSFSILIEDIIKLMPFSNEIKYVDCIHCG